MGRDRKSLLKLLRELLSRSFASEAERIAEFCRLADCSRATYYRLLQILLNGDSQYDEA